MNVNEKNKLIILPYPIPDHKLGQVGTERVRLGNYTLDVNLPPVRIGQRVMLRGAGKYIDSSLARADVQLLIVNDQSRWGNIRRDVQMELPIYTGKVPNLKTAVKKRLNIHDKAFDITIPPGLKHGQLLRLKNAGEFCNGGHQGDILLKITNMERNFWTMWGLLAGDTILSDFKFQIRFKIPYLFELGGEFNFKKQEF